jgi:alanine racemase
MAHIRRTWVEIDQQAFEHNINCFQQIIGPRVMISLIIKANAYGHGISEIATMAEQNEHIHMLSTVSLAEGLSIRKQGITKPILVLGIMDEDPTQAIIHDIDVTACDKELLNELNEYGKNLGKKCNIHIKVDTGLARLGVLYNEAVPLIQYAQTLPYIHINGICSHFAESSNQDQTFTKLQYERFISILKELEKLSIHIPYRHITNTASCTTYDLSMLNMIRIGAGIYGLTPSQAYYDRTIALHPQYKLDPVLSWHSSVCHIRTIPAQVPVGYDRTYITTKETKIALLPIGYSDGFNKGLSNKGLVYFPHAKAYAPVIGSVAMNMTTLDVTHIPDIHVGTEVILVGKQSEITANKISDLTDAHNARVITLNIHHSIPRVIVQQKTAETITITCSKKTCKQKRNCILK